MSEEKNESYINEIIRVTYSCNWKCLFCNVLKVNDFGDKDVSSKEIVHQILSLVKKYNPEQLASLNLSFSGGEPTLDKNLTKYISLAKKIGVGIIEIQTNGTMLFKNKGLLDDLVKTGLDNVFLAQHSSNDIINRKMGSYYRTEDFEDWIKYVKKNGLHEKADIGINIVVNSINLPYLNDHLKHLKEVGFFDIMQSKNHDNFKKIKMISFGFCQPNGYAEKNADEVLLKFDEKDMILIREVVDFCKENNVLPDFHFTAPPLCILDYPEYNLEYSRLKKLREDETRGEVNKGSLDSYENLWREKIKLKECVGCGNSDYCLGFYRNWIEFAGTDFIKEKIRSFKENHGKMT